MIYERNDTEYWKSGTITNWKSSMKTDSQHTHTHTHTHKHANGKRLLVDWLSYACFTLLGDFQVRFEAI